MTDLPPGLLSVPAVDWIYTRAASSLFCVCTSLPPGSPFGFEVGPSTIQGKRNKAVRHMLRDPNLQWLLFLDSDMVFPRDVAYRLLHHDADIVGGLYVAKGPPHYAMAGHEAQDSRRSDDPLRPTDVPEGQWRCETARWGPEAAIEVDVLGTGCMLIRRPVLEALEAPWFCANECHGSGQNEDFNFCLRARDLGFRVVLDTSIELEHIGPRGITPELAVAHATVKAARGRQVPVATA